MSDSSIAKILISIGVLLVIIGGLYYLFGDKLKWIGNLPGDIRIDKGGTKIYFPITTMILLSLILNLLFRFINYLT